MVRLELLQSLELLLEVAHFAEVSDGTGLLNVLLVFLDVLVDAFHDRRPRLPAEVHGAYLTGPVDQTPAPCALVLMNAAEQRQWRASLSFEDVLV